jgi:hypothetical protein
MELASDKCPGFEKKYLSICVKFSLYRISVCPKYSQTAFTVFEFSYVNFPLNIPKKQTFENKYLANHNNTMHFKLLNRNEPCDKVCH